MSRSPLQNLAELIPSELILQELDSPVKSLPTVAQCPKDSAHKAILHPDSGSVWAACQDCGFTGDSIDILKAKFQNPSVESVITRLESSGVLKTVSRDAIAEYQASSIKRNSWTRFISESKQMLAKEQCDPRILQAIGATPPFRKEWHEGFGKFAGTANKEDLCRLFDLHNARTTDKMLLLPYFDLPGRMANLRIVSYNSRGLMITDRPTNRAGGLFMLETVSPSSEYVVAVDDPITACKLQLQRMMSVVAPLPIVAWHPETKYWPIAPKRTVFWAPVPSVAVYNQARKVPSSFICTPSSTLDFDKLLQHRDVKNWVHHVMVHSKPWALSLKELLLGMPEDDAIRFSRDLDITPLETGELLFECTSDDKAKLANILDVRSSIKNVMMGDVKVLDKDGAWWTHTEKGRLVRVSNAPFVLEKSAHYEGKGSYLIGTLTMSGRSERFMAPAEQFVGSPARWLRSFALKKGMGLVQVLSNWDRKLIDLATSMNPEKLPHVEGRAVVGWSPDMTRFVFPCVTLANGTIDERDMGLPTDNMPCIKLTGHPTQRSTWREFSEDTPANRVFWATLACVTANICARYFDYPVRKIGVIGPQRSLAQVSSTLDLHSIQISGTPGIMSKLQSHLGHDVPVGLVPACKFKPFIDWLEGSGVRNVLVSLNHSQAALLCGKDWTFIDARDFSGPIGHFHTGCNILVDMIRMVQTGAAGIDPTNPAAELLSRVYDWGRSNKCDIQKDVFVEAGKLILPESVYGSISPCEGFLFSLFSMIQDDQVSVSRAGFSKKPGEVELSDKHVKVAKSTLQKMMLPIDTNALTRELDQLQWLVKSTSNDWLIAKDRWEDLYGRWSGMIDQE